MSSPRLLANDPDARARDTLAGDLHAVAIQLLRRLRVVDTTSGISPARLSVLSVLVFRGPQTIGELAGAEQVKPPTMTKLVQGLVAAELVVTSAAERDRRVVQVEVTEAGRALLLAGRDRRVQMLSELLVAVPEADRATLGQAVMLLRSALGSSDSAARSTP